MIATTHAYALIGRSHSSDAFELLFKASLAARAERRANIRRSASRRLERPWHGSGEPVTLPLRLPD